MFISDIDGTLLNSQNRISKENLEALQKLRSRNIPIILATGRNLFSVYKAIPLDFPADYIIFSTGLGILDWKKQKLILEKKLHKQSITKWINFLQEKNLTFFAQALLPKNHYFYYWKSSIVPDDFYRRISLYHDYNKGKIDELSPDKMEFSQLIAVFEEQKYLDYFQQNISLQFIRSTSPLDHTTIWLEIFPHKTSKGHAIEWLCHYIKQPQSQTMSIGNDYNDKEMLDFTAQSFCVANAPAELKKNYKLVASNNQNGVAQAVAIYLKKN